MRRSLWEMSLRRRLRIFAAISCEYENGDSFEIPRDVELIFASRWHLRVSRCQVAKLSSEDTPASSCLGVRSMTSSRHVASLQAKKDEWQHEWLWMHTSGQCDQNALVFSRNSVFLSTLISRVLQCAPLNETKIMSTYTFARNSLSGHVVFTISQITRHCTLSKNCFRWTDRKI